MSNTPRSKNRDNVDIPSSEVAITRGSLHRQLKAITKYQLTLINAPPGYGKTTGIAQHILSSEVLCAWHTVDESERDLPNLHRHCVKALEFVAPGIEEALASEQGQSELSALAIAHYIQDHVEYDIIYVLDDWHLIAGASKAEQWLQVLARSVPKRFHLVVSSRMLPDLPLAEFIARGSVMAIGQDQLRFTHDDAAALVRLADEPIPVEQVCDRIDQLEGWPAGVMVALRPIPRAIESQILAGTQGPESLFAILADTLLQRQSPFLRDFLLSSSILGKMEPDACQHILGTSTSRKMIDEVLRRNLFATAVRGGIVYHRLFQRFLQNMLRNRYPTRYCDLNVRAGEWYKSQNRLEEAFQYFIEAGAYDEALSIVDQLQREFFNQGKVETLLEWREALGEHASSSPQLMFTCAMIHTDRFQFEVAQDELTEARRGFDAANNATGMTNIQIQHALIDLRRGEYRSVSDNMTALLDGALPSAMLRGRAMHLRALAELGLGEVNDAIAELEAAEPIFASESDLFALSAILQDLQVAYERAGRLDEASSCLHRVVALRRKIGRPDALAHALNNLGVIYHLRGNYTEAKQTFDEGLQIATRAGDRRTESYLHWSLGDLLRDTGAFDKALDNYNRAYELAGNSEQMLRAELTRSIATLYRWQQEFELAFRLEDELLNQLVSEPDSLAYINAEGRLWATRVDQPEKALLKLKALQERMQRAPGSMRNLIEIFCAGMALRKGDHSTAAACLQQIGDQVHLLLPEILYHPELYRFVKGDSRYKSLVDRLNHLESFSFESVEARDLQHKTTYSVRICTLGNESISRDTEDVKSSDWRANRPREFFLYLLLNGPQTRASLSLEFWPDETSARVRSNFHTTLHRARRAIGENVIIFEGDKYRINPHVRVWWDGAEMQRLVKRAGLLPFHDAGSEDLWQRAVNLHQGMLLPSLDATWIEPHRVTFDELHVRALLGLTQCVQARGDHEHALTITRRVLDVDPYMEAAHRLHLVSYAGMGERQRILSHFKKMDALFRADLGFPPSPETTSLMHQLTG